MKYLVLIKFKTPENYDQDAGVWDIETESEEEAINIAVNQEKRAYGDKYVYTIYTKAIEYKGGEMPNFREEMDKADLEYYKEFASIEIAKELRLMRSEIDVCSWRIANKISRLLDNKEHRFIKIATAVNLAALAGQIILQLLRILH